MKKLFLLLFAIVFVIGACEDRDDIIGGVNIRVKNETNFTFLKVQVGADDKIHENVASGDYSEYLEYETAYQYDFIKIDADSTSYVLQPTDFVGEDSLNFGFYTYELNVSQDGDVLLNFEVD